MNERACSFVRGAPRPRPSASMGSVDALGRQRVHGQRPLLLVDREPAGAVHDELEQRAAGRELLEEEVIKEAMKLKETLLGQFGIGTFPGTEIQQKVLNRTETRWYNIGGRGEGDDADVECDQFRPEDGRVWLDGSCEDSSDPFLARAGWAAVQINEQGIVSKAMYGNVPGHIQQSAVNGEHLALLMSTTCKLASPYKHRHI